MPCHNKSHLYDAMYVMVSEYKVINKYIMVVFIFMF